MVLILLDVNKDDCARGNMASGSKTCMTLQQTMDQTKTEFNKFV